MPLVTFKVVVTPGDATTLHTLTRNDAMQSHNRASNANRRSRLAWNEQPIGRFFWYRWATDDGLLPAQGQKSAHILREFDSHILD